MTAALRVLIVDDEQRERLKNLLADLAPELPNAVVAEAADGVEALDRLNDAEVDIALIDIRMPRMDGIELARTIAARPQPPAVVFVTAYDQYAVKAFELSAVDYLLKPVRAPRLLDALKKARRLPPDDSVWHELSPHGRRQLQSSERGRILLVPVDDILFLRAELKYVTARTAAREFLLEESLTHLEQEFGERFVRVHRNCLVARGAIAGCQRATDADGEAYWAVLLRGCAEPIAVSRRQWPQVKALIKE
jgi:two-component system response regulator AlgR